jgi:protein tyrosine/serine phosphatase
MGIKTVLNLRHRHGDGEKRLVESAGLRYERIALASNDTPRSEQVARFLEIVRDPSLRPLYVHCQHGVDRTGAMMAVYRIEDEGWSNPEAFAEMEFFDAHLMWQDLRNFVRAYRPQPRPARLVQPR